MWKYMFGAGIACGFVLASLLPWRHPWIAGVALLVLLVIVGIAEVAVRCVRLMDRDELRDHQHKASMNSRIRCP